MDYKQISFVTSFILFSQLLLGQLDNSTSNSIGIDVGFGLNTLAYQTKQFRDIVEESNQGKTTFSLVAHYSKNKNKWSYRIGLKVSENSFEQKLYGLVGIDDIDSVSGVIRSSDHINKIKIRSIGILTKIIYSFPKQKNLFIATDIVFDSHISSKENKVIIYSDGERKVINNTTKGNNSYSISNFISIGYKKDISKSCFLTIEPFVGMNTINFQKSDLFFMSKSTLHYGISLGTNIILK